MRYDDAVGSIKRLPPWLQPFAEFGFVAVPGLAAVGAVLLILASLSAARAARVDTQRLSKRCEVAIRPPAGKTQTVTIEARWSGGEVVCRTLFDEITEAR